MENKLYYQDAYLTKFTAMVEKQEKDPSGKWYVVLNHTAFYPTGGGQPHDLGTIENTKIVNVKEIEGEIRHYLEGPLTDTNKDIHGVLDWKRRFDHMQQHAGQHILSAAFEELLDYKTVGFHLGEEIVTIDLATEVLSEQEVKQVEELANQIILENRPIKTKWVTEEELSAYSLRKETKVKDNIRLVMIPDFDYNGCGGTHPRATGEVRAIKILDWERQRKNIRVQFVCGERVLTQFDQKQRVLLELTKLLNAPESEMIHAASRLVEQGKALEKELDYNQQQLLTFEARELLAKNENRLVSEVFQNRTIQALQKLARIIIAEDDQTMVFFVSENENRLQLVCARGQARTENMKSVLEAALLLINGKGGGNDSFAQGGGEALMTGREMIERFLEQEKKITLGK
ncbi:serine-tRNA(Ala) deacylase AlaX [Neobacillus vireti]|uniref:Alanyl-tRNA synthetase n=1 Tax=Neobacillus vireti LMG 21834 TaxID=1131730 RepID=A0AB94INT2_9BACI|nr:serine-tRNA(Ala) deacylase AlaX [Neobacillus vireti]ETI68720.1 alanyl-tRNA synthetase [Neobacillus vireti LMG 21834]KLT18447.1 alanyl-tRNA synthetase [Neobacillus vireti]